MSNPYALFLNLLPKNAKIIAKVYSVSSDGTVLADIPGSNTRIRLRGDGSDTYAQNDHVYVMDNVIIGKTPPLQELISLEVP